MGVTIDDARAIASTHPRSYEAVVRDRVKFRVGQLVYAAFSQDETIMGVVASEPDKFLMPLRHAVPMGAGAARRHRRRRCESSSSRRGARGCRTE